MIKALIADDETLARCLIREYLRSHPNICIVGEASNGMEAMEQIEADHPDLIFLDIQMPKLSGFEVLEASGRRSGIIFTTAYEQHALKAFELHAVDYLLKPFSQARFDEAVAHARKMLGQESSALDDLVAHPVQRLERILIRDRGQVHIVPVASIDYVEAQDDYIRIHTEGKSFMKTQRLSDLEAQLDPGQFVRVHRSFLVNAGKLQSIERNAKNSHVALLRNGMQIPISRAGYERVRSFLHT